MTVKAYNLNGLPVSTVFVHGRTFEQWREQLQTELDPMNNRVEAFRALALFGANGRGKEATEAIVDAAKNYDFSTLGGQNTSEQSAKWAAVEAFSSDKVRIPIGDSLPILMEKFAGNDENERRFAQMTFWMMLKHFDKEHSAFCCDKLMQWSLSNPEDKRPALLLRVISRADHEMVLRFLRETIQKGDTDRFRLFFANFTPAKFGIDLYFATEVGMTVGTGNRPLGLEPDIAKGEKFYTHNEATWMVAPQLTPFGQSLLDLLRSVGVRSSNEEIRTTSQQVVDALTQIAELER